MELSQPVRGQACQRVEMVCVCMVASTHRVPPTES